MKSAVVAALGAGLFATALVAVPAHANPSDLIHVEYGCRSATFVNRTLKTGYVHHYIASSDDPGYTVTVPSGQSRTVTVDSARAKFFGWDAKGPKGEQMSDHALHSVSVDLNKYCSSNSSTPKKSPTAVKTTAGGQKAASGGLAKTGV